MNKHLLFSIFLAVFFAFKSSAQPMSPPEVKCVAIQLNGDVTLSWTVPPLNGNLFDAYDIYYADTPAGPFNLVLSVPVYLQSNAIIPAPAVSTDPDHFYIVSRFNGGTLSVPSDTISTIYLTVTNQGNGTLLLNWNPIHVPAFFTTSPSYRVFRGLINPGGNIIYSQISNSVVQTNFVDTGRVCDAEIFYRIEIDDLTGCTSVSNIASVTYVNPAPVGPFLTRATVDPGTQRARLDWVRSTSRDTKGYNIYFLNAVGSPVLIDYVQGWNTTTWIAPIGLSNAQFESETFRVATVDSCDNVSAPSLFHNTIFLESSVNSCTGIATLEWNQYKNWFNGVQGYIIYVSQNGSPFAQLATVPATDTVYYHFPLIQSALYTYYIEAFDGSSTITSSSNYSAIVADVPIRPQFLYVKNVSVEGPREVSMKIFHDVFADIKYYRIMKSVNEGDTYEPLDSLNFDPLTPILSYTDTAVFTNRQSYWYKVVAIDSCDAPVYDSDNFAQTIFLKVEPEINMENIISWSDYDEWNGGVRSYRVFRGFQGAFSDIPVENIPFGINVYRDDVTKRQNKDGEYCYYVQAYQGLDTLYFFADSSKSNTVCVRQAKTIYIPNAFTPDGVNKVFKPNMTFINPDNYLFMVFNKWGEKVFETREPENGWDGTVNGRPARMDTYIYLIRYQNEFFQFKEERGPVTLIR
jgi:gliding motility-associated-like protein